MSVKPAMSSSEKNTSYELSGPAAAERLERVAEESDTLLAGVVKPVDAGISNNLNAAESTRRALEGQHDVLTRNQLLEAALNMDVERLLPGADVVLHNGLMQECIGTLPEDLPTIGNSGAIYTNVDGEQMGSLVYGVDEALPQKLIAISSGVLKEDEGHGRRLYLEALKALPQGFGLASHSNLSSGAIGAWEWLVSAGVATKTDRKPDGQIGIYETVF